MKDNIGMKGWYVINHYDHEGNLIEEVETPNSPCNLGFKEVAQLIGTDTTSAATAFDYIAVGTGTTAAAATQTALVTEVTNIGLTRASGTGTNITTTVAYDTFQLTHSFSPSSSAAVTESAVLNLSAVGVMLCRQTFSAINVTSGDTLTITWKVAVAAA